MSDELPWKPKTRPCEWCGEPVDQLGTRAPRLYCRRSHRQRAFEARKKFDMEQRLKLAETELQAQQLERRLAEVKAELRNRS